MHEVCFSIVCPDYFLQTQSSGLGMYPWENEVLEGDLETVESPASLLEMMVQVLAQVLADPRHRAPHRNADRLGPRNAPGATFSTLP